MTDAYTPKRDEALFRLDGDLLVPGVLTRGPWYEGTLHGSAMLAAVARAAEQCPSDVPRQVVRLTVDMVRAAPMRPLRVEATPVRSGKNLDLVDVTLHADDLLCVRASALRFRTTDLVVDAPVGTVDRAWPAPPDPDQPVPLPFAQPGAEEPAFHHAIDVHVGGEGSVVWFRLAVPVVEGEEGSSSVAVAAVADWTYAAPFMARLATGEARSPADQTVTAINTDTTINTFRPLSGRWLGLQTTAHVGTLGAGTSSAQLVDRDGPLGFSSQSVLLRGPSGAPPSVKEL